MTAGKNRRHGVQPYLQYPRIQAPAFAPQYREPVPGIDIQVLGSKNATVAKVTLSKYSWDGISGGVDYKFEAADSSKREQGDVYDADTGELLALARVLQRLSRDLFSEAGKRVKASVAEQEKAREAQERKAAAVKPVKRRTREEWEAVLYQNRAGGQASYFPPRENGPYGTR